MKMRKQTIPKKHQYTITPQSRVVDITLIAAVSGIIGSKLFSVFENFGDFLKDPIGQFFSGSGLTIYGGLILATYVVLRYVHKKGMPVLHVMDAGAPAMILGYAVGRMGCQLSGDGDWGIVNTSPKPDWFFLPDWLWSFRYPHNVIEEGGKNSGL